MDKRELQEERRKLRADAARVEAFRHLIRQEGWDYFVSLLNAAVTDRMKNVLEPSADGETLKNEHNKGTVYGIIWARDLLPTIIATHEANEASNPTTEDDDDAD